MADTDDRTEPATQRRVQKARDEGQVAVSRDLSLFCGLSAGSLVLAAQTGQGGIAFWLAGWLQMSVYQGAATWRAAGLALLVAVAPVALASSLAYAAATLLQTGFLLHPAGLAPDLARISPLAGVKRLFSAQTLVAVLKALAKLCVFALCLYRLIADLLPGLGLFAAVPMGGVYRGLLLAAGHMALLLVGAQAAIAVADTFWERFSLARRLRMTRQELRDEHKETEGNPQIRQRFRQLARQRARRRMMAAVPKAALVLTNPTHYAVALAYERGSKGAPRLVAKGADEVADRIREIARESRVPIVANPPLARALFRLEIDTEIPQEHFRAVAEMIAYVWRLRARAGRR